MQETVFLCEDVFTIKIRNALTFKDKHTMFSITKDVQKMHSVKIILDMNECDFIDSAGLGMILHLAKETKVAGNDFSIIKAQGIVRELLLVTRIIHT